MSEAERIKIPELIEKLIGYEAWTALSWAIHHGWVAGYKWLLSERAGLDVFTPHTVESMLVLAGIQGAAQQFFVISDEPERGENNKIGTRGLLMFSQRINPKYVEAFRHLLVMGSLLGHDFVSVIPNAYDQRGELPIDGEIRRYYRLPPDLRVTHQLVKSYWHEARIPEEVHSLFYA